MVTLTPPVALNPGQGIAWCTAQNVVYGSGDGVATNGSAIATLTTADFTLGPSRPLGNWYWYAKWSNFVIPRFPAGWNIDAIYAVVVCSGNTTMGNMNVFAGPPLNMVTPEPAPPSHILDNPQSGVFSGQYTVANAIGDPPFNFGTTTSVISNMEMGARLFSTIFADGEDFGSVQFIGLAVYFTPVPEPNVSVSVASNRPLNS